MGKLTMPKKQDGADSISLAARLALRLVIPAVAAGLLAAPSLSADQGQAPAAKPAAHAARSATAQSAGHSAARHKAKPSPGKAKPEAAKPAMAEAPKPPELPNWPANDKPAPAAVVWDSRGLRIDAANSSLEQILKDVQTATGATVEGTVPDQRIFGSYGPGLARDVLSQLLQGTGYNVLMVGDLGQGAPRQIVLSERTTGEAQPGDRPAGAPSDDDAAENEGDDQQQNAPPIRSGFVPGGPPRTPQQIMQEMQQRQQQMGQQRPTPP